MKTVDLEFFFDPVCPFCWVTSQWVRLVQGQRSLQVSWRPLSLRMLHDDEQYARKPKGYPQAHERGLELLRVIVAARAACGPDVLEALYRIMGEEIWHAWPPPGNTFEAILEHTADAGDLDRILRRAGLPTQLAAAAQDTSWDELIRTDTDDALERTGGDVGTPILSFAPPDGPAFFGPVISDVPDAQSAVVRWEAIETLARWPGFAELKRPLRRFASTPVTARLAGTETRVS
jgi:2-hydroxychromene-2-carboxylate isomerase